MANGDPEERRKDVGKMAEHIATIMERTEHIKEGVDKLTATVDEERDKREKLGNRVSTLEERTRTAQWLQGIATAISTALGVAFGRAP